MTDDAQDRVEEFDSTAKPIQERFEESDVDREDVSDAIEQSRNPPTGSYKQRCDDPDCNQQFSSAHLYCPFCSRAQHGPARVRYESFHD